MNPELPPDSQDTTEPILDNILQNHDQHAKDHSAIGEAQLQAHAKTHDSLEGIELALDHVVSNTAPKDVQKVAIVPGEDNEQIANTFFSMLRGKPGEKGDKGDKGQPGEKSDVGPVGPQGIPGETVIGPQGKTGATGPKGDKGESIVGPEGKRGPAGKNGKDGTVLEGTSILQKIKGLIRYEDIEDAPTPVQIARHVASKDYALAELADVAIANIVKDQSIKWDGTKYVPYTPSGGGGGGAVSSVFGRIGDVIAQAGDYTTAKVTEVSNLYFTAARALATALTGFTSGAGTVTSSDTILSAIQKIDGNTQLLTGAIIYQGTWNASTNTPTLNSSVGTKGYLYKVAVAGTTSLDGLSQWNVGDSVVFDGTTWDKIDGIATEVTTVFGRVGPVIATAGDYTTNLVTEATNLYFTIARVLATALTGFVSGAGTVSATDTVLQAIQKLNGNIAGKQAALGFTPYNATNPSGYISGSTVDTLTNKRIQPRTSSTTTTATLTPDLSNYNVFYLTAQSGALTIAAPIGTPVIGETIAIYITAAAAQTLTFNAVFKAFGAAFPATTTAGKDTMITAQFNGTNWNTLVAIAQ